MMGNHIKFEEGMEQEVCQKACCSDANKELTEAVVEVPASCCSNGCCSGANEDLGEQLETTMIVNGATMVNCTFSIDGFDCADCAAKLEKGIGRMKGVVDAKVNFASAKMKVNYDNLLLQPADIVKAVSGFGYQATLINAAGNQQGLQKKAVSFLAFSYLRLRHFQLYRSRQQRQFWLKRYRPLRQLPPHHQPRSSPLTGIF